MTNLPLLPLLALYLLLAGLALFVTKPSSGLRAVVLTLIIGITVLGTLGFAVTSILNHVSYEESWYNGQ